MTSILNLRALIFLLLKISRNILLQCCVYKALVLEVHYFCSLQVSIKCAWRGCPGLLSGMAKIEIWESEHRGKFGS